MRRSYPYEVGGEVATWKQIKESAGQWQLRDRHILCLAGQVPRGRSMKPREFTGPSGSVSVSSSSQLEQALSPLSPRSGYRYDSGTDVHLTARFVGRLGQRTGVALARGITIDNLLIHLASKWNANR